MANNKIDTLRQHNESDVPGVPATGSAVAPELEVADVGLVPASVPIVPPVLDIALGRPPELAVPSVLSRACTRLSISVAVEAPSAICRVRYLVHRSVERISPPDSERERGRLDGAGRHELLMGRSLQDAPAAAATE